MPRWIIALASALAVSVAPPALAQQAFQPSFRADDAELRISVQETGVGEQSIRLRCEGTHILLYLSLGAAFQDSNWLLPGGLALLIDGRAVELRAVSATLYGEGRGSWGVLTVASGYTGWLESIVTADRIEIAYPGGALVIPISPNAAYESQFILNDIPSKIAALAESCSAERFGRDPQTFEPIPEPLTERAALQRPDPCRRCESYLETEVVPGTVRWTLVENDGETSIAAFVEIPGDGITMALTISKQYNQSSSVTEFAFEAHIEGGETSDRFVREGIAAIVATDDISGDSLLEFDPNIVSAGREPLSSIWANEMYAVFAHELIGLGEGGRDPILILEKGDTGRAVFAAAFEAWGL